MTRRAPTTRLLACGLALLCGLAVAARFPRWHRGPDEAYVLVAADLRAGRPALDHYDDEALAERTAELTQGRIRNFLAPSPPSIGVLLLPLAWIPTSVRSTSWLVANLLAFVATCGLMARVLAWPWRAPWGALAAAAAVLFSEPLAENLARGQIYLLLMPAAAAILVATATGRPSGAVGLALCSAAKLWGGPVWLAWLAARAWRLLALAGIATAGLLMFSVYLSGLETWRHYVQVVLPAWLSTPKMAVTAYQTLPGLLAHLFRANPDWNPTPLANRPELAVLLTAILGGAMLAVTMWRARDPEHRLAAVAASMVLAVMISPVAEQYHYLLLMPCLALALERAGTRGRLAAAALAVSVLLLLLPLPFKSPPVARIAAGVFAYPRLFGASVLWCVLVLPGREQAADEDAEA